MQRPRLLAAVVFLLLASFLLIVALGGELPNEVYAGLGIDPPGRSAPTPRVTQPACPSSSDIEWLVVNQLAEHFDVSPNDPRLSRYISGSSVSAVWRAVGLLCRKYRELDYPIAADFAERFADIGVAGARFRRDIYCTVKPELTDRELYSWDKSFDFNDWQMITGGQVCDEV